MYEDIFSKINISGIEKKIVQDFFDLALERILKNLYLSLGEDGRKKMAEIFLSQNQTLQEEFITTNLPNLEGILRREIEKLGEEIKVDLKK